MLYASHPCNQCPLKPTKGSGNRLVNEIEPSLQSSLGSAWQQPRSQLLFMTKAKLSYALLNPTENELLEAQGRGQDTMPRHCIIFYFQISFTRQVYIKHRAWCFLHKVGRK